MFLSLLPHILLLQFLIPEVIGTSQPQDGHLQSQHLLHENIVDELPHIHLASRPNHKPDELQALPAIRDALDVMQDQYFEVWQGIWSTAIDWTAAVMATYLSSALLTFSTSSQSENRINKHFSQLIAFYFGQDAFALRQEAYDDMLWVVLGWLESIKFIKERTNIYPHDDQWHGMQFIPGFSHRARLFWDLASQGWDTELCHGGMIWSPYLRPYKNAITNELFIAASVSMYLYFPGDDNKAPFINSKRPEFRDAKYLAAAIEGYKWLYNSNMTNDRGLYVDGFHISRHSEETPDDGRKHNINCDARNEMVFTYNQGVLLTGQRGLYEATGAKSYLEEGHNLVEAVIAATGYNESSDNASPSTPNGLETKHKLGPWHGLGRNGILEDFCEARAKCSQDAQTFKGIFFHHLTAFCVPLPEQVLVDDEVGSGYREVALWHERRCRRYGGWIKHNAQAAIRTLNNEGKFGMWWNPPRQDGNASLKIAVDDVLLPDGAVDYRNDGVPRDRLWQDAGTVDGRELNCYQPFQESSAAATMEAKGRRKDLNDRGRGRTVETQGGGIAILRAYWELVQSR